MTDDTTSAIDNLIATCEQAAAEMITDSFYRSLGKSLQDATDKAKVAIAKSHSNVGERQCQTTEHHPS
jgi:hypothetical protein